MKWLGVATVTGSRLRKIQKVECFVAFRPVVRLELALSGAIYRL